MPAIPYPSWLPKPQRAQKNMSFQNPFRSDVPAVGAPIFQPLTDDISTSWSLRWVFTLEQERAFSQWLRSQNYLNNCNNWFSLAIDIGGSGMQLQELHFTDFPAQTSIDGGAVTWTGSVICRELFNSDDEFDDIIVEIDPVWWSILDIAMSREMPRYTE